MRRTVLVARAEVDLRSLEPISYMKAAAKVLPDQEPIGIVISRGTRDEATPVFSAYVWGPAPEPSEKKLDPQPA